MKDMKRFYQPLIALLFVFGVMANAVGQTPDVWGSPRVVNSFPYSESFTASSNLHNDYQLPGNAPDGNDAVFKLTFSNDMEFSA